MNILNKLTIKSLKLNKTRTLVAILGIILATCLISVTVGLGCSLYKTLIKHQIEDSGDYHVVYYNLTEEQQKKVVNNDSVDNFYTTNSVGYAKLDIKNKNKNLIHFIEYNNDSFKGNNIKVIEGRLPENSNEVIIERKMAKYGFDKKVGDEITFDLYESNENLNLEDIDFEKLNLGDDIDYEQIINNPEMLTTILPSSFERKKYTIVGIMNDLGYELEEDDAFLAITYNDKISTSTETYVKYKKPSKILEYFCDETAENDLEKQKCIKSEGMTYNSNIESALNDNLLFFYGVGVKQKTKLGIFVILSTILAIISVCCIIIIKNSFSISVNERYKQYGMYSSIGATKKQLRKNVLFEGLIEGVISIPIGIILGCAIIGVLVAVTNNVLANDDFLSEVYYSQSLYFNFPILGIILIIIVSSITVYLSCLIPAIKISRVSPIEAIRDSDKIKINKKKLKSSRLIKKLFGIGGVLADKNIKRNRKKYKTIVLSLTISVILFICISAGANELKAGIKDMKESINYNYIFTLVDEKMFEDDSTLEDKKIFEETAIKIFEEIGNKVKLDKYAYTYENFYSISIDKSYFTDEYEKNNYQVSKDEYEGFETDDEQVSIFAVNDDEFRRMSNKYSLTQDDIENGILIYNFYFIEKSGNKIKYNNAIDLKSVNELKLKYYVDENESKKDLSAKIIGEVDTENSLLTSLIEGPAIIVSLDFKKNHEELFERANLSQLYIYDENAEKIVNALENYDTEYDHYLIDISAEVNSIKNMFLIIYIFMYTFITLIVLISTTNIFNTISTSMMLRKKEFAVLRSMGMTDKEFNKMIILESVLYSLKALVYGIGFSIILLYLMYSSSIEGTFIENVKYLFNKLPYLNILITIVVVTIIILLTMFYSISKINKQNIIETIRNDNI